MKKIYRTVLLLTVFIFLSTYNPKNLNSISEKNHILFKIQKIEILNNFLVEKSEIEKKLNEIYNKNIFLVKRSDIEQPLKKIDFLEKIEVKKKYPNTIIVFGGPNYDVDAEGQEEFLKTHQDIDIHIAGEGEEPLRQLHTAIIEGDDWKSVRGLSYLDDNGEFVSNPDGDLLENIDDVPMFPYELFKSPRYDRGFINSARGCPYKCNYCSQRLLTGLTYRWHSEERVVENLRILIEDYGQKDITFYDDNFSVNKKRVFDLCDRIVAAGLHKKCGFERPEPSCEAARPWKHRQTSPSDVSDRTGPIPGPHGVPTDPATSIFRHFGS